jgi:hypothetical protein
MASAALSRRVGKVVVYPPPSEISDPKRRKFHETPLDADTSDDLPGNGRRRSSRRNLVYYVKEYWDETAKGRQ